MYHTATLTKQLTWYGPGYYLNQNTDTHANQNSALVRFTLDAGSDDTKMVGLTFVDRAVVLSTTNIFFIRCGFLECTSYTLVAVNNSSNVFFTQCMFRRYAGDTWGVALNNTTSNIYFNNCIVYANHWFTYWTSGSHGPLTFDHCVFINSHLKMDNSTVTNSIFQDCMFEGTGNTFTNCIDNGPNVPSGNDNQLSVDLGAVFAGGYSEDAYYIIQSGCVAEGAGSDGSDIGAYGGSNPYVLSGLSELPRTAGFYAPMYASPTSGLPVQMRVVDGE